MDHQFRDLIELLGTIHLFDALSEEELISAADLTGTQLFRENEVIYRSGHFAGGLFIIGSGRVKIVRGQDVSILQRGDIFGEESLMRAKRRKTSAVALTNVVLFHINNENIDILKRDFPTILGPIRVAVESFQLRSQQRFSWRAPRESIQFLSRKHGLFLLLKCMIPFLIGLLTTSLAGTYLLTAEENRVFAEVLFAANFFVILVWLAWIIIDWANDFSILTNRRAIALEKVALLYEKRQEAPLEAIHSIEVKTDLLGRWFGYGNIILRTFTGTLTFRNLARPDLVVRLINEERLRSKMLSKKTQRDYKEDTLRTRLGYDQRRKDPFDDNLAEQANEEAPASVHSGTLTDFLSGIFRLRTEKDGIITYRTHWFVLLKKIFLPTLVFVLMFVLLFLNAIGAFTSLPFLDFLLLEMGVSVFVFLWWLYQYIDWRNDRYIITDDQVIDVYKKPLGQEQKRSAPLKNIQTVEFERLGLISLILNFGTVFIRVGDTTFTFDYVYNPSAAQSEIFERYQEYSQKQVESERERQRQEMAEWIEIYHQVVQNGGTPPPPPMDQRVSRYNRGEKK